MEPNSCWAVSSLKVLLQWLEHRIDVSLIVSGVTREDPAAAGGVVGVLALTHVVVVDLHQFVWPMDL